MPTCCAALAIVFPHKIFIYASSWAAHLVRLGRESRLSAAVRRRNKLEGLGFLRRL